MKGPSRSLLVRLAAGVWLPAALLVACQDSPGPSVEAGETTLCSGGTKTVVLLVDPPLRAPLTASLERFAGDLCAEGYRVWRADDLPGTPPGIRAYLAAARDRSQRTLTGAILIGSVPHAYQLVVAHSTNPAFPDTREEAISFQYYADVDGQFSASPGYAGAHPFSYDVHAGNVDWELWIGVLPVYKGDAAATVDAMTRYFDKNHAYRTGGPKPPRGFIQVSEFFVAATPAQDTAIFNELRSGTYAWTPFSSGADAQFYFDGVGRSVLQGYDSLRAGVADVAVVDAHGDPRHSGLLTIASVDSDPLRTVFFWSNACAVGDLDVADNLLSSVLYSPTSSVLVAKGTTNNSGGMGNNVNGFFGHNVAVAMSAGASFGEALLAHVNVPLVWPWNQDREFHFGTPVTLGDPTLRLRQ